MNAGKIVQTGGAIEHFPLIPLTTTTLSENGDYDNLVNLSKNVIGGIIEDGLTAWRATGSTIEVFNPLTHTPLAAWTFGNFHQHTMVTCVCGIGIGTITHLAIGVQIGSGLNSRGLVGILSLTRSRIVRAFSFNHKVTAICMVTRANKVVDLSTLCSELRYFEGIMAVATSHSLLFLIDLALDLGDEILSDENSTSSYFNLELPDPCIQIKRRQAVLKRNHLMICLSNLNNTESVFQLLDAGDSVLFEAPTEIISATCLTFIPQLASLVVGFNFGGFQIYNLNSISVMCGYFSHDGLPPVFSFAYQEPEEDPKCVVYLWVSRSPFQNKCDESSSTDPVKLAGSTLYLVDFEKKEWIEGHGLWYQNFTSISPKFEFEATGSIGQEVQTLAPSRYISAFTVDGTTSTMNSMDDPLSFSNDEVELVPEMSLCLFFWEANILCKGAIETLYYVAIFDINQWYQSQMPCSLRLRDDSLCSYMSFHMLDRVPRSLNEVPLFGSALKGSWTRYQSRNLCEKEWYPSSLSYEFKLLTTESLVTYRCTSVQQHALSLLSQRGPGALVVPSQVFQICVFSGVLPYNDGHPLSSEDINGLSIEEKRSYILDIAFEYHLLSLLVQCVLEFKEGKFVHLGCSLELLFDWAWKQLTSIKISCDKLCSVIFTRSSDVNVALSAQQLTALHRNLTYLSHLSAVVTAIRDNSGEVTDLSAAELEGRVQIVNLLQLHLRVILWFYHCGLLPERSSEDLDDIRAVPFPAALLQDRYVKRRDEISNLDMVSDPFEVLLIDCLVEDCGLLLTDIWGVDKETGKCSYPPPSLYALLSLYLLPKLSNQSKHRIVQYLFLDLTSILSENYSSILLEFVKFPSSFSLSPSLIKLTQAFWLIDNKDFQAGLSFLLDPLVNPADITLAQHRRILKAFLRQGEPSLALTFTQIRSSPKFEQEDICLYLCLLLANGHIREAFHFQRKYSLSMDDQQLLIQFFDGCEGLGRLESIVHFPLLPEEEEAFVAYLKRSNSSIAQDILLVYYLQQSRYNEISHLVKIFNRKRLSKDFQTQEFNTRVAIVQSYVTHLPDVQNELNHGEKVMPSKTVYSKPQPLSARIRQSSNFLNTPKTKSSMFKTVFESSAVKSQPPIDPFTPFRNKTERRKAVQKWKDDFGLPQNLLEASKLKEIDLNSSSMIFPTKVGDSISPSVLTEVDSNRLSTSKLRGDLDVIFSTHSHLEEDVSNILEEFLINSKNLTLGEQLGTPEREITKLLPNSDLKLSADVFSLLKTPPVRTPSVADRSGVILPTETPQSILKVRKIMEQQFADDLINDKIISSPFPSFPLSLRSSTGSTRSRGSVLNSTENESCLTPKQLRFDLSSLAQRIHSPRASIDEKCPNDELTADLSTERSSSPPPCLLQSEAIEESKDCVETENNISLPSGAKLVDTICDDNQVLFPINVCSPSPLHCSISTRKSVTLSVPETLLSSSLVSEKSSSALSKSPKNSKSKFLSLCPSRSALTPISRANISKLGEELEGSQGLQDDSFHSVTNEFSSPNSISTKLQLSTYFPVVESQLSLISKHSQQHESGKVLEYTPEKKSLPKRVDECLQSISSMASEAQRLQVLSDSLSPKSIKLSTERFDQASVEVSSIGEKNVEQDTLPEVADVFDEYYASLINLSAEVEKDLLFKKDANMSIEEFAHRADAALDDLDIPVLEFTVNQTVFSESSRVSPELSIKAPSPSRTNVEDLVIEEKVESVISEFLESKEEATVELLSEISSTSKTFSACERKEAPLSSSPFSTPLRRSSRIRSNSSTPIKELSAPDRVSASLGSVKTARRSNVKKFGNTPLKESSSILEEKNLQHTTLDINIESNSASGDIEQPITPIFRGTQRKDNLSVDPSLSTPLRRSRRISGQSAIKFPKDISNSPKDFSLKSEGIIVSRKILQTPQSKKTSKLSFIDAPSLKDTPAATTPRTYSTRKSLDKSIDFKIYEVCEQLESPEIEINQEAIKGRDVIFLESQRHATQRSLRKRLDSEVLSLEPIIELDHETGQCEELLNRSTELFPHKLSMTSVVPSAMKSLQKPSMVLSIHAPMETIREDAFEDSLSTNASSVVITPTLEQTHIDTRAREQSALSQTISKVSIRQGEDIPIAKRTRLSLSSTNSQAQKSPERTLHFASSVSDINEKDICAVVSSPPVQYKLLECDGPAHRLVKVPLPARLRTRSRVSSFPNYDLRSIEGFNSGDELKPKSIRARKVNRRQNTRGVGLSSEILPSAEQCRSDDVPSKTRSSRRKSNVMQKSSNRDLMKR